MDWLVLIAFTKNFYLNRANIVNSALTVLLTHSSFWVKINTDWTLELCGC